MNNTCFFPLEDVAYQDRKSFVHLMADLASRVTHNKDRMWRLEWTSTGLTVRLKRIADYEKFCDALDFEHEASLRQYGII